MAVKDKNILPDAAVASRLVTINPVTAVSQSGVVIWSFTPGYAFQVSKCTTFCNTKAGTVTAALKVGSNTASTLAFTAATEVTATLSSTLANLRGSSTDTITLALTTDGSGALTFPTINITFRPFPMNGEAY